MQINIADCKDGVHCVLQYQNFKASAVGVNIKDAMNKAFQAWLNEYWRFYVEPKREKHNG